MAIFKKKPRKGILSKITPNQNPTETTPITQWNASSSSKKKKTHDCIPCQCQGLTLKGQNCTFSALPDKAFCAKHLDQSTNLRRSRPGSRPGSRPRSRSASRPRSRSGSGPVSRSGSRPGSRSGSRPGSCSGSRPGSRSNSPTGSLSSSPPRSASDFLEEVGVRLARHGKAKMEDKKVSEVETLTPICRHCKTIILTECNLCQTHGCRMRVLHLTHDAVQLCHSQDYAFPPEQTPPASTSKVKRSSSSSQVHLRHPLPQTQIPSPRPVTLQDILPKLKVCPSREFGMPLAIPISLDFLVWERWWHVKQSHLGASQQLGLFSATAIPKGEDLFPFIGPEYDSATFQQITQLLPGIRHSALSYVNHRGVQVWIDGGTRHCNVAGFIHNGFDSSPILRRRMKTNVAWEVRRNLGLEILPGRKIPAGKISVVMTVSTRAIAAGDEICSCQDREIALLLPQLPIPASLQPSLQKRRTPSKRPRRP